MRMVGVHKTGLPPLEKLSLGPGMLRALSTCFRTSRSVFSFVGSTTTKNTKNIRILAHPHWKSHIIRAGSIVRTVYVLLSSPDSIHIFSLLCAVLLKAFQL